MDAIVLHPKNKEQMTAVKAFAKALNMNFETKRNVETTFLSELKEAVDEIKQIKNGKSQGRPAEALLNEL